MQCMCKPPKIYSRKENTIGEIYHGLGYKKEPLDGAVGLLNA